MHPARRLWLRIEAVHAVTYFSAESRTAAKAAGLRGFWMGYFGFRAAPLGPVGAAVVEAVFAGFAPAMVRRSVPDAWSFADPAVLVMVRSAAAAAALRSVHPEADGIARASVDMLDVAVAAGTPPGRPLFAANRDLPMPTDPVERLWQACTTLREHRGDGHVAMLVAEGIDGCAAHLLHAAESGAPAEVYRDNRGWTAQEWSAAAGRLRERGLLAASGALTPDGRRLRTTIEARTDELAWEPFAGVGDITSLLAALDPLARTVAGSAMIPQPNPMGLPQLDPL